MPRTQASSLRASAQSLFPGSLLEVTDPDGLLADWLSQAGPRRTLVLSEVEAPSGRLSRLSIATKKVLPSRSRSSRLSAASSVDNGALDTSPATVKDLTTGKSYVANPRKSGMSCDVSDMGYDAVAALAIDSQNAPCFVDNSLTAPYSMIRYEGKGIANLAASWVSAMGRSVDAYDRRKKTLAEDPVASEREPAREKSIITLASDLVLEPGESTSEEHAARTKKLPGVFIEGLANSLLMEALWAKNMDGEVDRTETEKARQKDKQLLASLSWFRQSKPDEPKAASLWSVCVESMLGFRDGFTNAEGGRDTANALEDDIYSEVVEGMVRMLSQRTKTHGGRPEVKAVLHGISPVLAQDQHLKEAYKSQKDELHRSHVATVPRRGPKWDGECEMIAKVFENEHKAPRVFRLTGPREFTEKAVEEKGVDD